MDTLSYLFVYARLATPLPTPYTVTRRWGATDTKRKKKLSSRSHPDAILGQLVGARKTQGGVLGGKPALVSEESAPHPNPTKTALYKNVT